MLEQIRIGNFKSLGDITLDLRQFNCLIGMNGSGKSSILQAIDFLSQLMSGNIKNWLSTRGWLEQELNCKLIKKQHITVISVYRCKGGEQLKWGFNFNQHGMFCSAERILLNNQIIFELAKQEYISREKKQAVSFHYQGSILASLLDSELAAEIIEFRDFLKNTRSLELLSPHLLRKRARKDEHDIGMGGEKLSGYLSTIKGADRLRLLQLLQLFYPNLIDYKVVNMRAGWKKLLVIEQFEGHKLETEAMHLSDGLLRILAVLAQRESSHSLILLDEIENGINPELIEKLVDMLVGAPQQILVTTHSPMILNYLQDDTARKAVQFVYKNQQGLTKIRHFFSLPRISKKLEAMGPGEAFIDTNLAQLTEECVALDLQTTPS